MTRIFHPNIYNDGQICLGEWRRRRRWRRGGRRAAGVPAAASLASGRNRPPRPIMTSRQRHLTFLPPHHCSCQTFSKTSGVRSTTLARYSRAYRACFAIRTRRVPPTPRRAGCTTRTGGNTTGALGKSSSRAGWTTRRAKHECARLRCACLRFGLGESKLYKGHNRIRAWNDLSEVGCVG